MDQILLAVLGIVLVAAGFITALLVIPLFSGEKKGADRNISQALKQATEPARPAASAPRQARTLQVWHDPQKDRLVVELDGQIYEKAVLLSPAQRSFLSSTATELVAWMSQASIPSTSPEPAPTFQPISPPFPLREEAKPVYPAVARITDPANPPGSTKGSAPARSLTAQIDEILQEKLALSGMSYHMVHLIELPNYGMSIQVDKEQYENIDAVPDEEVRKLIRSAVEEWQRRSQSNQP